MCGRFSVNKDQVEEWVLDNWDISFSCESNSDLRPTQTIATLSNINGSLKQLNTTWGIKPAWSKKLLINAQGETAATKKTFKESFNLRRCLVPFSGWYEWHTEGNSKQKYAFSQLGKQPLLMAGIWFETDDVPQIVTLTTRPNERCAAIHKRMPVLIKPEDVDYWFNSSAENLQPLIEPIDGEMLSIVAV